MEVLDRCRDRLLYDKQWYYCSYPVYKESMSSALESENSLVLLWLLATNSSVVSLLWMFVASHNLTSFIENLYFF
jgi:hypothetical protein